MAGEAKDSVANRLDNATMMLVVGDHEWNGDARVYERLALSTAHD